MPRPPALLGTLALDRTGGTTLQRQLYDGLREAILAGRLAPRTRLPSSRQLARDLGAARNTIVGAFEQLVAEGYLEARVGDGTRIAAVLPESLLHVGQPAARRPSGDGGAGLSARGRSLTSVRRPPPDPLRRAFQPGLPALDEFPRELWARLLGRRARLPARALRGYAHPAGLPILREAIAAHLGPARGVACDPAQVIVVSGSQAALDLCCRLLLDPGDPAWIEEPGYLGARGALTAAGARLIPVPVDAHGLDVQAGVALAPAARLAYVTPSHQFPLGITMTLARRLELLAWAAAAGAWILEDDYDSEYRYAGRPVAAVQGLDPAGRVISIGTFSKTMFPAVRAAWLVVPPALVDTFAAVLRITGDGVNTDVQAALADFLGDGHFAAHVRRMRGLYADRQARLVRALRRRLDGLLDVEPRDGGMQLPAFLPPGVDDVAASRAADTEGITAAPLTAYHLEPPRRGGFYLGYAGVPEREITAGVERLARVLEPRHGGVVRRAMLGSPRR
jgi:GntR family transcriptional regulator/MocR family aminotransferase